MGFGKTAKKVTALTAKAEKIYSLAKELHEKLTALKEEIEEMRETMKTMDEEMVSQGKELAEQRQILEALAEEQGLDVDEIVKDADREPTGSNDQEDSTVGKDEITPSMTPTDDGEETDDNEPDDDDREDTDSE